MGAREHQPVPAARRRVATSSSSSAPRTEAQLLARQVGNRAFAAGAARATAPVRALMREQRTILGERVHVRDDAEATEAEALISAIESEYGIDVSSRRTTRAVRARYATAPQAVLDQVYTRGWRMKELRALYRACSHFAPILGSRRASSNRARHAQEATRAGAVSTSINDARTAVDAPTMGEYFRESSTLALYRHGLTAISEGANVDQELEWTATHEIAHGLMEYAMPSFLRNFTYWRTRFDKSNIAGAEAPPTAYGQTNAAEDMCDTVGMYFVQPRRLRRTAPKRYRWVRRKIAEWTAGQTAPDAAPVSPPGTMVADAVPGAAGAAGSTGAAGAGAPPAHAHGAAPTPAGVTASA